MTMPANWPVVRRGRVALAALLLASALLGAAQGCSDFSEAAPLPLDAGDDVSDRDDALDGRADRALDDADVGQDAADRDGGPNDTEDAGRHLIAFVTSNSFSDVTSSIPADTKCRGEAEGRLPGRFVAWYSDPSKPAISRLVDSNGVPVQGPWYRVDGKRIVASRSALVQATSTPLENAISVTAANKPSAAAVWTATKSDGTFGAQCPASAPTSGLAASTDGAWTEQTKFMATCGSSLALYCFQVE